jgi:hypothetical protein
VELVVSRTTSAALFAGAAAVLFLLPASRLAARLPLALACLQLFLFSAPYRLDRRPEEVFAPAPGLERLRSVLDRGSEGGGRFVRFGRDRPLRPYPLSSVLPPSTNVPYRLRDLQGYNALADRRLGEALETALGEDVFSHGIWRGRRIVAPERPSSMEHPLLDALAVRAAVSAAPWRAEGWVPQPARGFVMMQNLEARPRAQLVGRGRGASAAEVSDLLRAGEIEPAGEVVWVGEGEVNGSPGTARVVEESWNGIAIRVRSEGPGILVVADSYSPGWRAEVDGDAAEILPVWGVVRGVSVPAGEHLVRMRYEPPGYRWGILLSLVGLGLAGTALAFGRDG